VRLAARAASMSTVRKALFPARVRPLRRFPALSSRPGHTAAQLHKWPAVGKNVPTSGLISLRIASAVRRWTPGIVSSRASAGSKGAIRASISLVRAAIASSRKSILLRIWPTRNA
jgi:hypothetical protein